MSEVAEVRRLGLVWWQEEEMPAAARRSAANKCGRRSQEDRYLVSR